jgi:tRNA G46 methylase TrmB
VHEHLKKVILKHKTTDFKKPIADHAVSAFADFREHYKGEDLILDLGVGTGQSTKYLAENNLKSFVLGIDRSLARTQKAPKMPPNAMIARTEMWDVVRLLKQEEFVVQKAFLLYPNPCPKPSQFASRVYGHPVFPDLISICKNMELRTNWQIGALEMQKSLQILNKEALLDEFPPEGDYMTRFEEKYAKSGQTLWRVVY